MMLFAPGRKSSAIRTESDHLTDWLELISTSTQVRVLVAGYLQRSGPAERVQR